MSKIKSGKLFSFSIQTVQKIFFHTGKRQNFFHTFQECTVTLGAVYGIYVAWGAAAAGIKV